MMNVRQYRSVTVRHCIGNINSVIGMFKSEIKLQLEIIFLSIW